MFKFNFTDLEDDGHEAPGVDNSSEVSTDQKSGRVQPAISSTANPPPAIKELTFDSLIQDLPPVLSYSPLSVPLSGDFQQKTVRLLRRDLFDARYQLISQANIPVIAESSGDTEENTSDAGNAETEPFTDTLAFVDNPSDLVPGVYEGGLKTWECALDLVDCLVGMRCGEHLEEKRIIELGCGTAMPSLFLIDYLFRRDNRGEERTEFVLQDYNDLVLRLITFPNVLLAWCASPLAQDYWAQNSCDDEMDEPDEPFDPSKPGDLHITPSLLSAFRSSLNDRKVQLRFFAGSWEALNGESNLFTAPFDIILTSETIYQVSSLLSLIELLRRTCHADKEGGRLEEITQNLSLDDIKPGMADPLCLVAAKVLYFGVGGGIMDFERLVKEAGGEVVTAEEKNVGVGRRVMRVHWNRVT